MTKEWADIRSLDADFEMAAGSCESGKHFHNRGKVLLLVGSWHLISLLIPFVILPNDASTKIT